MSVRLKILLGCLSLIFVTVIFGEFTRRAETELGTLTVRMYDEAFMGMSYLREAQARFATMSVSLERLKAWTAMTPEDVERVMEGSLPEILAGLKIANERAMSPGGEAATADLAARIGAFLTNPATLDPASLDLDGLIEELTTAVEIYAGDGYGYRRRANELIARIQRQMWIATAASVLVALLITFVLARSIVPAVRTAVAIAEAIAAGRLDTAIVARGRGEMAQLLRALAIMQAGIRASLARINDLLVEQARNHAGQIASRDARFEAALDNMTHGLLMFDAEHRLAVVNRRFAAMFSLPEPGVEADRLLLDLGLARLPERGEAAAVTCELADGRMIAVSCQPIPDGGWVCTFDDVTERCRTQARLAHMARHDALTGLPNRLMFREHMDYALARVRRGEALTVLCLDLDHFKKVNDTLGHAVGDELLLAVTARLRTCVRETDMVVRLGGDEFAIIQAASGQAASGQAASGQPGEATALARRLIEQLSLPYEVASHLAVIGVSIGIAFADDGHIGADALLKNADIALYRAKAEGRGTFRFFEEEMDARMQARRSLELDLRRALPRGELELFYQPLLGTERIAITGFEALIRWRHPERGMVSPAEFIPLAEEIGLIEAIGAWVLHRACADAARWPEWIKIAVNLSPIQFRDRNLAAKVAAALRASGLAPGRLELEITESVLLQDNEAVLAVLHELRALGARISMDDFGTGYSSLSYLRRFPFDKIKIDQSFVRNLGEHDDTAAIVRAVINLGQSLGMAVIAEGVETSQQLETLRLEGCREVQGYLFSPPKPVGDVPALLDRYGGQVRPPPRSAAGGRNPRGIPEGSAREKVGIDL